jgi:hypothetical protein
MNKKEPAVKPFRKPVPDHRPPGWNRRETYDGAELRPFEGRPGAMDAYKLPSKGIG